MLVLIYFTHQFSVYGLSYFLPGIIGSWGQLTPLQIGLLTAIPWIAAAAVGSCCRDSPARNSVPAAC